MKHLTIIYNPGTGPVQLYDGPVEALVWSDTASAVRVEGQLQKAQANSGLLDLISAASKKKTIAKKAELEATE